MANTEIINDQDLEGVTGGSDWMHDLANYECKTVCNVITLHGGPSGLAFCKEPNGEQIPGILLQNGEMIRVHRSYRENGWPLAIAPSGQFGYVNPNNVR